MKLSALLPLTATMLAACASSVARPSDRAAGSPSAAPRAPSTARPATLDARLSALLAADRAHAAASASSLVAGFPASLAADAVFLYPGRPIAQGRDATAALLRSLPNAAGRTMTWRPVLGGVSADGTRGYTVGYGERGGIPAGSVEASHVKYIAFWKKDDAGRWQVAAWALGGGAPGAPDTAPAACSSSDVGVASAASAPGGEAVAAATRDAVRRADSSFAALAARAGAAEAFGTYVADGGASLGGGAELTCGRDAVRRSFASVAPGALVWEPRFADGAASGDLGFTVGVATIRGELTSHYSKYLTVWRKQPDGEWRFVADGGNPMP